MIRVLKSMLVIVAVAAVATGATSAYFSDQEPITGNTFATGTLNLTLNHSANKPFSVSGAYPGYWTGWEHADIYNTGSMPFEAYMTLSKTAGDTVLWDELRIKLETSGGDSVCHNGGFGENVIYDGKIKDFVAHSLVSSLNYWHLANEADASGSPADNVRPGYSERVCQQVGLDVLAPNSIQGKTVTFSEIVDAEQDND